MGAIGVVQIDGEIEQQLWSTPPDASSKGSGCKTRRCRVLLNDSGQAKVGDHDMSIVCDQRVALFLRDKNPEIKLWLLNSLTPLRSPCTMG